jgi:hypothetical protein
MLDRRRLVQGVFGGLAWGGLGAAPAGAQLVNKYAEQLKNGEYNWFPERSTSGPLLIIVSIPDQLVHVYRNGIRVAASTCSTGKPGHSTPTGVFKILQKDKHHKSSTYSNAPMPNMNRLTWSGIALHAGKLPGYPASHGCVRLPIGFSELLFGITKLGVTVVLADDHSQPASVTHPGLVLGDYARHEFGAVGQAMSASNSAESHISNGRATSLVVSRADRKVFVYEDHKPVASHPVTIQNPGRPIGERVYTLVGLHDEDQHMQWSAVSHSGKGDREDHGVALQRITADAAARAAIGKRLHHGMTLVTTDEPHTAQHRSDKDFVIVDGIY